MMVINTAENNSIASGSSSEAGERKPQSEERIQDLDSNSLGMEYNDQNKDDQVKPTSFKEHLVTIPQRDPTGPGEMGKPFKVANPDKETRL